MQRGMNNLIDVNMPSLSKGAFLGRMTAGVLLLNLFVIALICVSLNQSRNQYEERAAIETRNLAQVLEQHIDGIIDKTDVVLFAAAEESEQQYARGGIDRRELSGFLSRMASRMPELERLLVANARGRVVYHTGSYVEALTDVSDREYFHHLRNNPGAGLYISKPIRSRISGKWVIILARRINFSDGSFSGTVSTGLSLDYLNMLFASIHVGPHGAIELRDGELGLIASSAEPAGTESIIGEKKVSREMAEMFQGGITKGTYKTITPVDRIKRTYSFRRLSQHPLYIVVGLDSRDYLKEWHGEVSKMSLAALIFLSFTLLSSLLIYKGWRSRTAMIGALAEQEVKYRTVADYTYDWEYWVGPDGAFRYISPSCERITGYGVEMFSADPGLLDRLIHHADREQFAAHRCGSAKAVDNLVFRIVRADGSIRWLEHTCQPIVDGTGAFLGNRCCNRDITERMQVEHALRYTQFSVDQAVFAIFWLNEDGRFSYMNDACRYLGYSMEELAGMTIFDITPELSRETWSMRWQEMIDKGFETFERYHKTKSGTLVPVELTVYPVEYDGRILNVSYVRDISERKRAEARIARSEQKFRAIFECAHDGIFLIAADSGYIDCNPAAAGMFGCAKADIIAKTPQLFSPPSQPDGRDSGHKAEELIAAALEGKPQNFEWRHRRSDGSEFDATVALNRFELNNEPMLLAIVRDISQRKSLENQLYHSQKLEAVGQLAGGVAHDFNNILTVITGYGSMMKMKLRADDPQMLLIEQILSSSDRAAQLTQGLLAFSRKQIMNPKPVELNAIVKRVDNFLRRLIGEDVEFTSNLSEKPLKVMADSGQMEQVLMNLATNARDAMPDGGVIVIATEEKIERHFSFRGLIKPGKYALITVSDTGSGMDEKTREKIFEPFFTTKELGRGTGLGLAIVYGIIKQHNGFINVYSEPGRGTTFKIHLPLIPETVTDADAETIPPPKGGTETILLAEDDHVVRTMAGIFLRDFGYRVIDAVDGEDALEKFAEHEKEIDLLILDVMMPKRNGGEVYSAVKAVSPEIDILFVSGYAADIIHKKGIFKEDIPFISKPVSPFDLLRKIRDILDKNR